MPAVSERARRAYFYSATAEAWVHRPGYTGRHRAPDAALEARATSEDDQNGHRS